jgi:hypothetical protein
VALRRGGFVPSMWSGCTVWLQCIGLWGMVGHLHRVVALTVYRGVLLYYVPWVDAAQLVAVAGVQQCM